MSVIRKSTDSLSGNDKVRHYLQNSTNNSLKMLDNSSSNHLFSLEEYRSCSSLESDSPSHSDLSTESSLSDPIVYSNTIRSNLSSDEDLDFNIGFAQMIDEEEILHENNEFILAEYFRQSSNSTIFNDDYEKITADYTKPRAHFLHDSTYTLCSPERYSAYTEDNQDNEERTGLAIRSNSLNVLQLDDNSTFVQTAPKKVVRFADMLGLDLESIRYMTPPDQTTTSIIQECVRFQLGQFCISTTQLEIPNISPRSRSSSFTLPSPTKQYNLVSKNFTSPINIIPLIYQKQVLLECLYTKDYIAYGTIRVHNCAYHKRVFIRSTEDEWETTNDIPAWHSMNYSNDNTDTFTFQISLAKSIDDLPGPKRILFAVCLQTMSQEFWDNNQGWNYVLDVYER
jgi:hypothetical protein